jgi:hypothetical protein
MALALLVGFAAPARAESPERLYKRGVELRKAGKDAEALDVFKQLREIEKTPRVLAQLGLAEQAVGLWVEAEGHIDAALQATDDGWIRKNRDPLVRALSDVRDRLGTVEIWGEPAGAEVLIDGRVVGTLPLSSPVRVVAGKVPITVRAPEYLERTIVVTVVANEAARERFVLQRTGRDVPPAQPVASASPPRAPPPAEIAASGGSASPPPEGGTMRGAAKWVAWGAGTAALGVGILGLVRQGNANTDFNAACGLDGAGTPRALDPSMTTDTHCAGLENDGDSAYRLEVIGLVAAGALAAAGVVLWLTEPHAEKSAQTSMSCLPMFGGSRALALDCSVRF